MSKAKGQTMTLDGKAVHPLVYAASKHSLVSLGKALGHKNHSTVAIYTIRARRKPSTLIPAEWVLPLARLLEVRPAVLRPDLYLPHWDLTSHG